MKKSQLLGIIVVLITIIAILVAIQIRNHEKEVVHEGVILEANSEEKANAYVGSSLPGIAIPGRTRLELPAGVTEADISLHNPDANSGYYDLEFTLKLSETEEILFATGLIPPGYKCSHVTLAKKLDAGEYEAVLLVQPYLKDEAHTPVNNAELNILLIVK